MDVLSMRALYNRSLDQEYTDNPHCIDTCSVILNQFADNRPFVQARATAIRSGIPGAVFRLASQQPGGLEAEFSNETAFFQLTDKIYVGLLLQWNNTILSSLFG